MMARPERSTIPEAPITAGPSTRGAPLEPEHLTDLGDARRLVRLFGNTTICYVPPWKRWFVWVGSHWQADETGEVDRLAKAVVAGIYAEAGYEQDRARREELAKHAVRSESVRALQAMITLAQTEAGIPVLPEQLDRDPWLLNVANGTLALKTGTLRPHYRDDLITKQMRVFATIVALCRMNPALGESVTILANEIRVSNGTVIRAISSDYRGAAGSRHSLVVFDELWGFDSERAWRLYEELTPPPTEEDAWVLVVTYAGFTGESTLLEAMYQRGLAGTRVDDELEVYEADDLVMLWSHTPRMPWQTAAYYQEQARSLRPGTFARLHRNEWVTAESTAIDAGVWDACVYPEHAPLAPSQEMLVVGGIDVAPKSDTSAAVWVGRDGDLVVLVRHQIWHPHGALDFAVIDEHVRWMHAHFRIALAADPYQMHALLMGWQQDGIAAAEYPRGAAGEDDGGAEDRLARRLEHGGRGGGRDAGVGAGDALGRVAMGWFTFRRTSPGPAVAPSAPPTTTSETDLECFTRWRRYWASLRAQQDVAHAEQERQEAAARVERAARARDRMMSAMARNGGSWFPGDEADLFRETPAAGPRLLSFEQWRSHGNVDLYEHRDEG